MMHTLVTKSGSSSRVLWTASRKKGCGIPAAVEAFPAGKRGISSPAPHSRMQSNNFRSPFGTSSSSSSTIGPETNFQSSDANRSFGPAPYPRTARLFSSSASSSSSAANYLCVHVFVTVKPGTETAFLDATLANARASSLEAGVARFDVVRQEDDPTRFLLVEVYKDDEAPAAHKDTEHYKTWRKAVEDMMAEPRKAIKFRNVYPATAEGWDYGEGVR